MKIGSREFDTANECYIMGILNVTPDSFSDGGKFNNIDSALSHAEAMISEGADIIDVGGESTRPGFVRISDEEEISRIVPVIEALKSRFDVPVSIDTYKYKVASAAAEAGADLINDIYGLKYDNGEMADLIAKTGLPCCLMHNRNDMDYDSFMDDLISDMRGSVDIAKKAGITDDSIILDPGVGFAKSLENNLTQSVSDLESSLEDSVNQMQAELHSSFDDMDSTIRNAISENMNTLDESDVRSACADAMNYDCYSFKSDIESAVQSALSSELDSKLSDLDWKLCNIESKLES